MSASKSFIEQVGSKNIIPAKGESKQECITRLTHLYLNDKMIRMIGDLSLCKCLTVLYLHNNNIWKIENLHTARNLKQLYLQWNSIQKIENLDSLVHLEKLYLGNNKISVVEGLENLKLRELHIEKQNLQTGDKLCFDPRSVEAIADTLVVLNISSTGMDSLAQLKPLYRLEVLKATNNNFNTPKPFGECLSKWFYLREAEFKGCPASKNKWYKDDIIEKSHVLESLDGKVIHEVTRDLLRRHERYKSMIKSQSKLPTADMSRLGIGMPDGQHTMSAAFCGAAKFAKAGGSLGSLLKVPNQDIDGSKYVAWNGIQRDPTVPTVPPFFKRQMMHGNNRAISAQKTYKMDNSNFGNFGILESNNNQA